MVAVIKTGTSLRRIFHYNEQKVAAGLATCLLALNYPKDTQDLTPPQKLNRLLRQAALNENVTRPSVHISLNFDPSEQLLPGQLQAVATAYLERIGFGGQPCLVYEHQDAGHPHLHLVTLKVREDGSRIDMHNIGRGPSERARQEIEHAFGLVRAQGRRRAQQADLSVLTAQRVAYGRSPTRQAISQVLHLVLRHYAYTSLPELNAALGLYRVRADRGAADSRIYRHRGLLYRVLDERGQPMGVPLKASALPGRPTLAWLEERFAQNERTRLPHKARVRHSVDLALLRQPPLSLGQLALKLEKEGIALMLRRNTSGLVYGITYVDHRTRCVFNGSVLGKRYSAQGLLARTQVPVAGQRHAVLQPVQELNQAAGHPAPPQGLAASAHPLDILLPGEQAPDYIPHALKRNRKKKKRSRLRGSQP